MYRPLGSRIMVELLPVETTMLGEFSLPQGSIEPPTKGIIVGKGKLVDEMEIGETVMFDKKFGVNITDEGKTYRILEERDIFAVK